MWYKVDMPVFFYIDPDFGEDPRMENIESITLSYTFFEAKEGAALVKPAYAKWKFPFVSSIGVIV